MIYAALRRLLFLLDAEDAHDLTTAQMERLQDVEIVRRAIARWYRYDEKAAAREVWGLHFRSPLGIAAGFDKNARFVRMLSALGFGFMEVGTITLQPQPGNPRPRMFRFPEARAVVNRLGFNNEGADAVAARLTRLWDDEHARGTLAAHPPLFVNVGKNREVPIDAAAEAYVACYRKVGGLADAAVLNLSSPNTPSLRDLQQPAHLERLLRMMRDARASLSFVRPGLHPLLVKIAPDLDAGQLAEICAICVELADGIVATNTTVAREAVPRAANVAGGLSGAPLFARSTEILGAVRGHVGAGYPLVGVGGVFTADDVRGKIAAGADLVQSYTGFIYEGPGMPSRIARELAASRARPHAYDARSRYGSIRPRQSESDMIIYGLNPVLEAIRSHPKRVRYIAISRAQSDKLARAVTEAKKVDIPVRLVGGSDIDRMAGRGVHNGIVAEVLEQEYADFDDTVALETTEFVLILDGITDPQNLGAILRVADGFGVDLVVLPEHESVGLTPAAVKASAGASQWVPVAQVTNLARTIERLKELGYWVYAADLEGDRPDVIDFTGKVAMVMGNEGKGIRRNVLEHCDRVVTIPMRGHVESLNVATAAAVLCYEVMRQKGVIKIE